MEKTYVKNGIEYHANGAPTSRNLLNDLKQLLAVARWEREISDGVVSSQTTAALIHHLSQIQERRERAILAQEVKMYWEHGCND